MNSKVYDLTVIGGGPGGYVAAIRAAQLGMKTALVEMSDLGGVCLNWGCIPTKSLLRSTEVLSLLKNSKEYGVNCDNVGYDLNAIVQRSRNISKQLNAGVKHLLNKNGVDIYQARATIDKATNSQVVLQLEDNVLNKSKLIAKKLIVATGASARNMDIFPYANKSIWSYREALNPKSLPKKMAIIGAGVIGIEFASIYNDLGAEVHVLESANRILMSQDEDVSSYVNKSLSGQGIKFYTDCSIKNAKQSGNEKWHIELDNQVISDFDVVLVAIGVQGNSENLGLENVGINVNKSFIETGKYGVTSHPSIFAIGDVAGAPCLAHKASREAIVCVEYINGLDPAPIDTENIPACIYSKPQIASIGLTEAAALEKGFKLKVGKFPIMANGKALAMGYKEGFTKVVFDAKTGELLGAHMVGDEVPELIQGFGIAKNLETTEQDLMNTIFAHPTLSEIIPEAVLDAYDKAIHI